ncbi:MAG: hypothetical protein LW832_00555 [Parachlamydia sp.]|jgi:hypothetical protein|nr:hypothetical protein [Parachlamydia sp.]
MISPHSITSTTPTTPQRIASRRLIIDELKNGFNDFRILIEKAEDVKKNAFAAAAEEKVNTSSPTVDEEINETIPVISLIETTVINEEIEHLEAVPSELPVAVSEEITPPCPVAMEASIETPVRPPKKFLYLVALLILRFVNQIHFFIYPPTNSIHRSIAGRSWEVI